MTEYSQSIKTKALKMLEKGSVVEVSKNLGIPINTLYNWKARDKKEKGSVTGVVGKSSSTKESITNNYHREADIIFAYAQESFKEKISECAEKDDYKGIEFFSQFASQIFDLRKSLAKGKLND